MTKEYKDLSEAYQSIYEVVTDKPTNPTSLKPDPRSTKIVQDLFAKPSTIAPAASPSAKPAPTPPAAVKPASVPAATVSPSPTSPAAPAVPQKTFQQELDDLRKASAQATMAGPSKEAQALMSTRAKNILGPEKLRAGIEGQERVEKMKSEIGMPKIEAPKPATVPPLAPKLPPSTSTVKPTAPPPPKTTGLSKDELAMYNQATGALKGPFSGVARGQVKSKFKGLPPEKQTAFREYLKTRSKEEQNLYKFIDEQKIGIPLDAPTDAAAAKKLKEILPASEKDKVIIPKSGLQKAGYEYEDLYDEVLDYLINEGYSEEESKKIMVKDILTLLKNINN